MSLWQPGQSGNPSGRPKSDARVRDLARAQTEKAIETLTTLMDCKDLKVRALAAQALLDRGWGRPAQMIELRYENLGERVAALSAEDKRRVAAGDFTPLAVN